MPASKEQARKNMNFQNRQPALNPKGFIMRRGLVMHVVDGIVPHSS